MEVDEPSLQAGRVLLPRHAIHARRRLPLQGEKARPEQINGQMVEQRGEPFLLPILCRLPHTAQSLGHVVPALGRGRARLPGVLLGLHPFLPTLRRRWHSIVRVVHG